MEEYKNLSTEELIESYNKSARLETMSEIVLRNVKLVKKIASGFKNGETEFSDLCQIGYIGLIVAINRYDKRMNTRFSTFAVHCIRGEMLHHLRDNNLIRVPRWINELNKLVNQYIKKFELKHDRYPTKNEISIGTNLSMESIDAIFKGREMAFYSLPLENLEEFDEKGSSPYNKNIYRSRGYRSFDLIIEDKIILWEAIEKLRNINKKVLILKFIFGYSQEEIGKKIGKSQRTVSRHLNDALKSLKALLS